MRPTPTLAVSIEVPLSHEASPQVPSFEQVYAQHAQYIWQSLRRLGVTESSVEDALQDVFIVVHRRLAEFVGPASMRTWLYAIALHVARDYRRTAKRKGGLEPLMDTHASAGPGPNDEASRKEALRIVQSLLERLDDDKREVFVMVELEQMTIPEISEVLGTSINTLYSRLRAARADFDQLAQAHRGRTQ